MKRILFLLLTMSLLLTGCSNTGNDNENLPSEIVSEEIGGVESGNTERNNGDSTVLFLSEITEETKETYDFLNPVGAGINYCYLADSFSYKDFELTAKQVESMNVYELLEYLNSHFASSDLYTRNDPAIFEGCINEDRDAFESKSLEFCNLYANPDTGLAQVTICFPLGEERCAPTLRVAFEISADNTIPFAKTVFVDVKDHDSCECENLENPLCPSLHYNEGVTVVLDTLNYLVFSTDLDVAYRDFVTSTYGEYTSSLNYSEEEFMNINGVTLSTINPDIINYRGTELNLTELENMDLFAYFEKLNQIYPIHTLTTNEAENRYDSEFTDPSLNMDIELMNHSADWFKEYVITENDFSSKHYSGDAAFIAFDTGASNLYFTLNIDDDTKTITSYRVTFRYATNYDIGSSYPVVVIDDKVIMLHMLDKWGFSSQSFDYSDVECSIPLS